MAVSRCKRWINKLLSDASWKFLPYAVIFCLIKRIHGLNNVPRRGPVILALNHASHLDPMIVTAVMRARVKRRIHHLAKKELAKVGFVNWYIKMSDSVLLDREGGGDKALKESELRLKKGGVMTIFPEGTRSRDGKLGEGKTGIARLAIWTNSVIVPCALDNTKSMWTPGTKFPKPFKRTNVRFGKPISPKGFKDDKRGWRKLTDIVMDQIRELLIMSEYGSKNYRL
jgi:1-acyl-sn-glycerol-3-phosphate acyltransferase